MLEQIDIEVYYVNGVTYVKLEENLFFTVSDDGQKRGQATELPPNRIRTSKNADNGGLTGGNARCLIETACEVGVALKLVLKDFEKAPQ